MDTIRRDVRHRVELSPGKGVIERGILCLSANARSRTSSVSTAATIFTSAISEKCMAWVFAHPPVPRMIKRILLSSWLFIEA
jgi:hypothetical protein